MTYLMTQMLLCLLIAFLLGLLVGWWLGRRALQKRLGELEEEWRQKLEQCRAESAERRKDLERCRGDLKKCHEDLETGGEEPSTPAPAVRPLMSVPDGEDSGPKLGGAAGSGEVTPSDDDLTRIEGIGPKIASLLNAKGVTTWTRLADTEVSFLQSVLDAAGPRYRIHDPATWPRQARLAAAGDWDELDTLQNRLQGGREEVASEPDDLKRVEGIGPKIEGLLNAKDIVTWKQLAKTRVSFLQSVLDEAGPRYRIHDPATWPEQAGLAAAGAWEELAALQDRLKGGRET